MLPRQKPPPPSVGPERNLRGSFLGLSLLGLTACAPPALRIPALEQPGLTAQFLPGAGYAHLAYLAPGQPRHRLHVYLEGDGRPWRNRTTINADPTPHTVLMAELLAQDTAPRLFLGRPCYHGLATALGCSPELWTMKRYSEPVVASLAAALQHLLSQQPQVSELAFIGHSGGGTLALLLAARFPQTRAVVTLGANLDHALWTTQGGYTPLHGSLNAMNLPPLPFPQWHYVGARDTQVPPATTQAILRTQPQAHVVTYPEADHHCCWAAHWPDILAHLVAETGQKNQQ